MTAKDCAKYIIHQSDVSNKPMTNLRLQKTLYYAQGYSYRALGEKLFDDEFEHWQYGPVVPDVYFEYSVNGASKIPSPEDYPPISNKFAKILNKVVATCNEFASSDLVERTHQEDPWKNTSASETISNDSIKQFFTKEDNNPLNIQLNNI